MSEAANKYVSQRRLAGSPFVSSETVLRAFVRACGDMHLEQLTAMQIESFVNRPGKAQSTRASTYSVLKCFVQDCAMRSLLPDLSLQKAPKIQVVRLPYIYTQKQIQELLQDAGRHRTQNTMLEPKTLQLSLLLLYATGCTVEEVLSLRRSDLNFRRRSIRFQAGAVRPSRTIPIGRSLQGTLEAHCESLKPQCLLLESAASLPISQKHLSSRFRRLQQNVGICADGAGKMPRLQDLRYTFAVHRLRDWIGAGLHLDDLIPALSTYMGYASLLKAEEFLAFTPERFNAALEKISPTRIHNPWGKDHELLAFLDRL